ncbi:MAG: ATP-dependent 6-phosphofructokinase, partial [Myxococcales bacterium]
MAAKLRIGLLTGGGDCQGLNAVIRAVVKRAILEFGWEVVGLEDGYTGLMPEGVARPLDHDSVRGILPKGGTILGTSNKANPFLWPVQEGERFVERDLSDEAVKRFQALGLHALVAVGGDGTLSIAHRLAAKGLPVVGVPKTIDNDVAATDVTFGFDSARAIATDAIDKLHTTAEAHDRVMVLELMGRNAGWLTAHAGIAGGADAILIPEIPYDITAVVEKVRRRKGRGRSFSIVAVSEGAYPKGGEVSVELAADAVPGRGVVKLGGAGKVAAEAIARHVELETRVTVLGHLQRGGGPT